MVKSPISFSQVFAFSLLSFFVSGSRSHPAVSHFKAADFEKEAIL
jgi:hypothetical protein